MGIGFLVSSAREGVAPKGRTGFGQERGDPRSQLIGRQAGDQEPLLPRGLAGEQGDLRRPAAQQLSASSASMAALALPFSGGRGHRDAKGPGPLAEDAVPPGAGLGVDRDDRALGVGRQARSCLDPLEQGGADPDERGPFLDRDLEVARHPHRELGQRQAGPPAAARREPRGGATNDGRAVAASVPSAAIVIRPTIGIVRQAAIASASSRIASADQPCLVSSPEVLTWRQTGGGSASPAASSSSVREQLEGVDGVDHRDQGQASASPCWTGGGRSGASARAHQVRQGLGLRPELLRIVLAQVDDSGADQRADQSHRPLLRDRDQRDRLGPARPPARPRRSCAAPPPGSGVRR